MGNWVNPGALRDPRRGSLLPCMRLLAGCVWVWLGLLAHSVGAAEPARLRLYCLSVRVEPGEANLFGLIYRLTFSSAGFNVPNHEVYPIFEDEASHGSRFMLETPDAPEPVFGEMGIQVPESLDANTNGVPDFYEVAEAVPSATTSGVWAGNELRGSLRAVWQRDAGQLEGRVRLQLTSDEFGALPEFTHRFEILEYQGSLTYAGTGETRPGAVSLQRAGLEDDTLSGSIVLTRVATNRLNHFTVDAGSWTNAAGLEVPVSLGEAERDPDYTMDYFGALALLNGDPTTPEVDYELFYFGVDDPNDADADGIPDLTDDATQPPSAPRLGLRRVGDGVELQITGEAGATYTLERAAALAPDEWIEDRKVTMRTETEVVQLPRVAEGAQFFRMRWP